MKTCRRCKTLKEDSEFSSHSETIDGLQSYCRPCATSVVLEHRERTGCTPNGRGKKLWNYAKGRAKRKGWEFTVDQQRIIDTIAAGRCETTGLPFKLVKGSDPFAPSLDRVDNNKPYLDENVRVVVRIHNIAKNEWSDDAFEEYIRAAYDSLTVPR